MEESTELIPAKNGALINPKTHKIVKGPKMTSDQARQLRARREEIRAEAAVEGIRKAWAEGGKMPSLDKSLKRRFELVETAAKANLDAATDGSGKGVKDAVVALKYIDEAAGMGVRKEKSSEDAPGMTISLNNDTARFLGGLMVEAMSREKN